MHEGNERARWRYWMKCIAEPVMSTLAKRQLKANMPVEGMADRGHYTHLEAFGRTLAGVAPWLELAATGNVTGEEAVQGERWVAMAKQAMEAATDPTSVDYMNFTDGPEFKLDYYNSFVIQPMLIDVTRAVAGTYREWDTHQQTIMARARHYAHHLERLIAPDGFWQDRPLPWTSKLLWL